MKNKKIMLNIITLSFSILFTNLSMISYSYADDDVCSARKKAVIEKVNERYKKAMEEYDAANKMKKMDITSLSACLGEIGSFELPNLSKILLPDFEAIKRKICGYARVQISKVTDSVQDVIDQAINDIINKPIDDINKLPDQIGKKVTPKNNPIDKAKRKIEDIGDKTPNININDEIDNIWSK